MHIPENAVSFQTLKAAFLSGAEAILAKGAAWLFSDLQLLPAKVSSQRISIKATQVQAFIRHRASRSSID